MAGSRNTRGRILKFSFLPVLFALLLVSPVGVAASNGQNFSGTQLRLSLVSPHPNVGGSFGGSVAVSENIVVVGANLEKAKGIQEGGHAYVFSRTSGGLITTFTSPNPQPGDAFGISVATNGILVAVGADNESIHGMLGAGQAYVFNASSDRLVSVLTSPSPNGGAFFGHAIAISGNTVVVGALDEISRGLYAGSAYVFNAITGHLEHTLTSPNAQSGGFFGASVAIDGRLVAVGAPVETAKGVSGAGHAYIFDGQTGKLMLTLRSPDLQTDEMFGSSVAAGGGMVAAGAPDETLGNTSYAGRAYVFDAKSGGLLSRLTSPHKQSFGFFGQLMTIESGRVVVGAPNEDVGAITGAGYAYIMNPANGALISTLTSPNAQTYGAFGGSVGISPGTLVVGAPGEKADGTAGAGRAYVFSSTS